ncbi:MAG: hypothetical protein PHS82_08815 [Lachnospiraceae bacterium]|nr:hypothetical protein [Lachnospiraceae bacterium]
MKKKMVAAIMCITLGITSLAGCGKADPKESLGAMLEKDYDNMDMELSVRMNMDVAGEQMTLPADIKTKFVHANSKDMRMEGQISMELQGEKLDIGMYYADGYYYMDMAGVKIKYPMDIIDLEEKLGDSFRIQNVSANMLDEVTLEENGDTQIFSFKAKTDSETNELLTDILTLVYDHGDRDVDYEYSDIQGGATAKDGELQQIDMSFSLSVTIDGKETKSTAETVTKINATGDSVTVTAPNPDEYTEVSAEDM